jgi:hypothetical protein
MKISTIGCSMRFPKFMSLSKRRSQTSSKRAIKKDKKKQRKNGKERNCEGPRKERRRNTDEKREGNNLPGSFLETDDLSYLQ